MIKAVYFDLDDTLYDQLAPLRSALQAAGFGEVAGDAARLEQLFKQMRRHSDRLWVNHAHGQLSLTELRIERTTASFADMGLHVSPKWAQHLQESYEHEQTAISLRQGVVRLFEQLHEKNIPFGLITNGPVEHQWGKIETLGLRSWIDPHDIYISDGIGLAKPDPEVFRHVHAQTAFLPAQLAYVGDAWHNDVVPSYLAGWRPIWFNGRRRQPDDGESEFAYWECGDMSEVFSLIQSK
ncbi:putative hydrolase of the HAD superfamily [Paenibacillus endophyticus]|uniref:Putative hydrolase of the HAD superfamily n=1 Tax=Paenibacillus endophyticus TaxID=1294268 RepID=A0A7W5GAP9_9BACL|nr:HAD family hydrolase [Paenibacillus endophyticus]MBB3152996.1 putative hydrolase of the HAD superfamily [Paenibacillus endophyticus]